MDAADAGSGPAGRQRSATRLRWWSAPNVHTAVRVLAAAAGGLAVYAAFAPSTWWWMAILGFALFGLAVHGRRWQAGLGLGLVFGLALYLPLLVWTNVYVGTCPGSPWRWPRRCSPHRSARSTAAATRRLPFWPVWAAAAWITGEALRARFPFGGFPWGDVAFTQPDGPLLPAAALLGAVGLAFLTALAGFALAALVRALAVRRPAWRRRRIIAAAAALAGPPFSSACSASPPCSTAPTAPHRTIAVIQGNVPRAGPGVQRRAPRGPRHARRNGPTSSPPPCGPAPRPGRTW